MDLALSDEEFFALSPDAFLLLSKQWNLEVERQNLRAGVIAATVVRSFTGAQIAPRDFFQRPQTAGQDDNQMLQTMMTLVAMTGGRRGDN